MTEANTQAVVDETKAQPQAGAEVESAREPDLASFLDQYEAETKPQPIPETKPATDETSVVVELKSRLDNFERAEAQKKNDADFSEAVKQIKGDLDVPEFVVKGWLLEQAKSAKAIDKIWDNREQNPAAFKQMLARMGKEFAATTAKTLGKQVDANATEDKAAVAAAIRGASTKAPEGKPPNLSAMTNGEYRDYLKSLGISSAV